MGCVENYGYNNLSLSRFVARVFLSESTLQHMWIMWVYIVWVGIGCIRYDKLVKQNVLWVSHGKALPARHSRIPAVTIYYDSSHFSQVLSACFTFSRRLPTKTSLVFNCLKSSHSLTHTTLTIKSHIKYKVQKIEHNYNQIWHKIKTNTK